MHGTSPGGGWWTPIVQRSHQVIRFLFIAIGILAAAPAQADEQARLVQRSHSEADILWRRGFTLEDSTLDRQLQGVLDSLTAGIARPPGVELRVHVFRSPEINAF